MAAQLLFAQYDDKNAVAMPSPNSNFNSGSSQVGMSLYTGRPEVGIPLYTLPSKELSFPVSLTYSGGGGIKVQDVAGTAGLGWQLVAGGAITRVVRGLPDETKNGYIGVNHVGQTVMAGLTNDLVSKVGKGELDGEPDMFSVATPFFSLKFVLDAYGNPVFSNGKAYRIKHNLYNNNDTLNTSWVITDGEGNQYFFGSLITSRERMSTKLFDVTRNFTSTWYLDKIVAYNSNEVLNLTYMDGPDFSVTNYDVSNTLLSTTGPCSAPNNNITNDVNRLNTYKAPKYLTRVVSSLGEIRFDYAFDRQDVPNAGRLNTITVYSYLQFYFSNFIKKFRFNFKLFRRSFLKSGGIAVKTG